MIYDIHLDVKSFTSIKFNFLLFITIRVVYWSLSHELLEFMIVENLLWNNNLETSKSLVVINPSSMQVVVAWVMNVFKEIYVNYWK